MNSHSEDTGRRRRVVDTQKVRNVQGLMLRQPMAESLAEVFGALSDPTRIRLIYALINQELCVCDLAAAIGASESAVSHQLRGLRRLRLVKNRREGQLVFYSLADDHVITLLSECLDHVGEVPDDG